MDRFPSRAQWFWLIGAFVALELSLELANAQEFSACAAPESIPCDTCCDSLFPPPCDCCWCRPYFLDCCSAREDLAASGVSVNADITQFYMEVVDGGVEHEDRYSGHGDYVVNLDLNKMGGPKGMFVKLRAEHRFGSPMSRATGTLLPPNIPANLPVADSTDVYLTNVLITQMFSETFGVFAGKMDTLDGDLNAFAHGRGKTQFSNGAFVANPIALRTVVYSTLGAGFVVLNEGEPLLTFTVLNPTDTTRTSGFDELYEEGVVLVPELRIPTNFFGLPGHQLIGGTWSNREYVSLTQDPRIILPNVPINRQSGSWSLYWNFDQYLCVNPCNPKQGWGVFGRVGVADQDTNPIESFLSFGIGGNSPIHGRENDTFGIGWYRAETSDKLGPIISAALGGVGNAQGYEMYYDVAVTPWLHITPDLQIIVPARQAIDTAWLIGLRTQIIL